MLTTSINMVLLPARELTFTSQNILRPWETVGVIPLNSHQVSQPKLRKREPATSHQSSTAGQRITIPKTPGAVSRATPTALSLIQRDTPTSRQLKVVLAGIPGRYQETIAD